MGQSEYNEAQFEIEKAEAVKEARNAALEDAAIWVQKRCEDSESENLNYNAETIAGWIRQFKIACILLPLLFVFGVAAGESEVRSISAAQARYDTAHARYVATGMYKGAKADGYKAYREVLEAKIDLELANGNVRAVDPANAVQRRLYRLNSKGY